MALQRRHRRIGWLVVIALMALISCGGPPYNNPYPESAEGENILYTAFTARPKHLDPAQSYSSNEIVFTGQIYEPPLQYHYLKRPYELIPLASTDVPEPYYLDANEQRLPDDADPEDIAYSVYEINIQPGIRYQPHPAFARDADGELVYGDLRERNLEDVRTLGDFDQTGTRELTAADYIYQIKRLAHPRLHSPIFGLMSEYIVGLRDYAQTLRQAYQEMTPEAGQHPWLDLRRYPLEGVEQVDRYTYRVRIRGQYAQFIYWLAMPFFAPVPHEADSFYSWEGMKERNITLDWYPVGTGPYMLTVNNPNREMILARNPNFRGEPYPEEGEPGDAEAGLLEDAGKPMPFIDKVVFSLEKESIPAWNKFLQGYYDTSGISSDSFDQAVRITSSGETELTDEMRERGIQLSTAVTASIYYTGFNMIDSLVGGYSERARKLRQAISIAIDFEEYISIFANGRGIPAQGPLPPGIFGNREGEAGINPYVYNWEDGEARRKSIERARELLVEAGYPEGRDAETGKPLIIHLDVTARGPDDKARLDWIRKQLEKINVQLVVRATDYNRFQDKMLKGTAQMFQWGWNADYPDPENFMFLLYGPNAKVDQNGENAANYENAEFDKQFDRMKNMPNNAERQAIIDRMLEIVRRDAPWIWGFHPKQYSLYHAWYHNAKPNLMANNTMKYKRIDAGLRRELRAEWNQPVWWPVGLLVAILAGATVPAMVSYRRKLRARGKAS